MSHHFSFLSSCQQQVRNPLSSAISALSFVSSTVNDPNECQIPNVETRNTLEYDLRVMDASLQFINELLRNMLDVFRSASNQMKIELNPTDIKQDILEPVASILFLRGTSGSAEVKVECRDDLVCQVDRMRLKQIILNLASNSVKFVKKGFIRLQAKLVNESVEISVSDSGTGIPDNKKHRLFTKFQQSLDELNQGTGTYALMQATMQKIVPASCENKTNALSRPFRCWPVGV